MSKWDSGITMDDLLASGLDVTSASVPGISSQKYSYNTLYANASTLSYSNLEVFNLCPRKYELQKLTATVAPNTLGLNVDFVFGHAVAAGIQHYIAFGDEEEAIKQTLFAWNAELLLEDERKGKSIWTAIGAVQIFIHQYAELFADWKIAYFKGRPAIEFSFRVDLQNGYYFYGHVDLILVHKETKQLMVVEIKTNGSPAIHEAMYGNSPQALGYTLILDQLAAEFNSPEQFIVFYLVYKIKANEFISFPFPKTSLHKARWLKTLLLQCEELDKYQIESFFPQRSRGCFHYNRPCPFYGVCDMSNKALTPFNSILDIKYPTEEVEEAYQFKLIDLIHTQMKLGELK